MLFRHITRGGLSANGLSDICLSFFEMILLDGDHRRDCQQWCVALCVFVKCDVKGGNNSDSKCNNSIIETKDYLETWEHQLQEEYTTNMCVCLQNENEDLEQWHCYSRLLQVKYTTHAPIYTGYLQSTLEGRKEKNYLENTYIYI